MGKIVRYLGACMGLGAQIRACERGPEVLFPNIDLLYPRGEGTVLSRIHAFNLCLADEVAKILKRGEFPIVLGGDHSIAVGTWNGVRHTLAQPLGLVWIDAHMDGHTCETTPSGAFHGMPLAGLLGYGESEMAALLGPIPVLFPQNVILIGTRSFEEGEAALFEKLKIKIYFMEEVARRGIKAIFQEALERIQTPCLGLSLDLDAVDPSDAPGVGSPKPNGLCAKELLSALSCFQDRLTAFELVEYNPERDVQHKTRDLAYEILNRVFSSVKKSIPVLQGDLIGF